MSQITDTKIYGDFQVVGASTIGAINYAADTGAANAYVVTLSPAIAAYTIGQQILFKATAANTGASTLAVNGLTATFIKKRVTEPLAANDILAGMMCLVVYDGTNFVLMNPRTL